MFAALCRNAGKAGFLALALAVLPCAAGAADGDESWDAQFTETNAPNGLVGALAFSGTNLYVGGDFTNAGGVTVNRIAMWDGHQWTALGSGVSGPVWAIAVQGTNVFVGGGFSSAGDVANTRCIARWDGQNWHALGAGMADGAVRALAVCGTNLYAGGSFGNPGPRIARWDGNAWFPLGGGVGAGSVWAMAIQDTNLFIGGDFDRVNNGTGYNYVAKWNGSTWSRVGSYGAYGTDNPVMAMTAIGNVVYFGGDFTKAGGGNAGYFAKWNGSSWSGVGGGLDYWVTALANDGTNIYVGGMFANTGSTNASCIAKWSGAAWSPLGSGLDRYPNALAVSGGDLYAGCNSTNAGGKTSCYIAHWSLSAASVAPNISILLTLTNTLVVSWPAPAEGWVLEGTNALPPVAVASWPQISLPYQTNAGAVSVTVTNAPGTTNQFFRLHKP
jgi:trimeric autotransporter adhesin